MQMIPILPIYKGHDYTGEYIGSWHVTGKAFYKKRKTSSAYLWECECSCGTVALVGTHSLLYGRSNSCLPCRNKRAAAGGSNNPNWKGFGEIPGEILQRIKQSIIKRRIIMALTI